MQNFKIVAYLLLVGFLVSEDEEDKEDFVDNKGFLSHR
jgi:hypothetical protein